MFRVLKKSLKNGVVTGQYPETAPLEEISTSEAKEKARPFRSLAHFVPWILARATPVRWK